MKKKSRGFTLVELLTVIAIIGILASVSIVNLSSIKAKSRDSRRASELKDISLAADRYFQENYDFPDDISGLDEYFDGGVPKDPQGKDYEYRKNGRGYCFGTTMETNLRNSCSDNDCCNLDDDPATPVSTSNYRIKGP